MATLLFTYIHPSKFIIRVHANLRIGPFMVDPRWTIFTHLTHAYLCIVSVTARP